MYAFAARFTQPSAIILVSSVLAACAGGAGSASGNCCGGSGFGGSRAAYLANAPYFVPFSSQTISGTLQFPADQHRHQVTASASMDLPSVLPLRAGEGILTIVTVRIAGDFVTQVPTTIQIPLPSATLAGEKFAVYYSSDYPAGQWQHIDYSGAVSWTRSLTLTSMLLRYTDLGNNYFAIVNS